MTVDDHNRTPMESPRDVAAAWQIRLSSDTATEADWLEFEVWLAQSPENARASDAVEALWAELGELQPPAAKVVAFKPRRRVVTPMWGGAIAASLVAAVGLGLALRDDSPTTVYATAKGEQREVVLADGTHIRLNSGSRLSVRLGRRERRVEMADAEAAFDVTHDARRPFVIDAGDRQVRVVGTAFDVLRHAGRVEVAVRRGVVEVRPVGADAGVRLVRGQGVIHREGAAGADVVATVDPATAFAWTERRLVYRDRRLEEVAADLNRYLATPIVVAPDARELRLTADMSLDAEQAMLERLSAFLPIRSVREAGVIRLESAPARR